MDTKDLKVLAPTSPSSLNCQNKILFPKTPPLLNINGRVNKNHVVTLDSPVVEKSDTLPKFKKSVFTQEFVANPANDKNNRQCSPSLLSCRSSTISNPMPPNSSNLASSPVNRHSITRCYIFPTSAPLFPTTFIPNYVVTNPEQQDAIVFCGNYSLKIGLFYVKDINWNSNDSITSPCDIYGRGVLANITGYKFIQATDKLSSDKNQKKLIVNLRVLYNVEIDEENFWIPKAYSSMNERKKSSIDSSFTKNDTSWMTDASLVGDFDPNNSSMSNKNVYSAYYDSFYGGMSLLTNLIDKDNSDDYIGEGMSNAQKSQLLNSDRLKEAYIKQHNCFANLVTVTTKISKKDERSLGKTIRELSDRIYRLYQISKKLETMKLFICNSRQKMAFCNAYIHVKNFKRDEEHLKIKRNTMMGSERRGEEVDKKGEEDLKTHEDNFDPEYLVFKFYAVLDILKMFFGYLFANDISRLRFFMGVFQDINDKKLLSERVTQALKLTELAINVLNLRER